MLEVRRKMGGAEGVSKAPTSDDLSIGVLVDSSNIDDGSGLLGISGSKEKGEVRGGR